MDIIRGDGTLLNEIDLAPQNVYQEVLQNVAMILDTIQKSAPMKRGMGMPGDLLHRPLPVVENLMVARIYDQIEEYEPRAILGDITFEQQAMTGTPIPIVELKGVKENEQ